MRSWLLLLLLALLAGGWLLGRLAGDAGYVLIALGNTSIEMNLWLALLLVVSAFGLLWLIGTLLSGSWRSLRWAGSALVFDRSARAQQQSQRGLIDFMEGNWRASRRLLLKHAKRSQSPLINYLAAARSSHELGDSEKAFALLHEAEKVSSNNPLAVILTQARMQLAARQHEQCIASLERARKLAPRHPVVLELLQQVYVEVDDWRQLEELLPDLRRHSQLSAEQLAGLLAKVQRASLRAAAEYDDEACAELCRTWKALPGAARKNAELVQLYAELLLKGDGAIEAERVLRKQLNQHWQASLLPLYGLVEGADVQKQLLAAEAWLKERPANAELMLVLGRLCLRCQLWGRAREYFTDSLRLQPTPQAYAELARLLANLGEREKSADYYQQGLLLSAQSLPALPQPHAH